MVRVMSPFDSQSDLPPGLGLGRAVTALARLPRSRQVAIAIVAVVIVAGLAVTFGGRGKPAPTPAVAAASLTVATTGLTERHLKSTVSGVGSVVAWQELSIAAESNGLRVMQVLVDEGDQVKARQVLAKLDGRVLEAQLRQADAKVAEAKSAVTVAQNNQSRADELVKRGVISPSTLEDRKSTAESAIARLDAAFASRDELATRVAQTNIIAPTDGYVAKRMILIGDVVSAGKEAFRLVREGRLELEAQVPETDLIGIAPGQDVHVTHEGDVNVVGIVRAVAPTVDAKSRLGIIHVSLPANSGLRTGMYARAEITLTDKATQAVPESTVVWREDKPIVFVVTADSHVAAREIVIGTRQDGWIEVRQGLASTDRVVATGAGFLHDGDKVKVRDIAAEAQAAGGKPQ